MDFWLIGLIAAGVVVLYLVVLAVGVLLGVGSVLMQMQQPRPDDGQAEHMAKVRASQQRIEAEAGGRTVLPYPINRAARRKQRRRA